MNNEKYNEKSNTKRTVIFLIICYIISILVFISSYKIYLFFLFSFARPFFMTYSVLIIILPILGFAKKFEKANSISRKLLFVVLFIPIAIDLAIGIAFLTGFFYFT